MSNLSPYLPFTLWETVPFGDPDAWQDWLLPHWLEHLRIAKTASSAEVIPFDSLRQDPFPHGLLHKDQGAALGLGSRFDFTNYDLTDPNSYAEFMLAHSAHHAQMASVVATV